MMDEQVKATLKQAWQAEFNPGNPRWKENWFFRVVL